VALEIVLKPRDLPTPIGYKGYQGAAPQKKSRRTTIFAVLVVVIIALILFYAVVEVNPLDSGQHGQATYLSAPGTACTDPALPANIAKIEQSAAFINASGGSCYSYVSGQAGNSFGDTNETLVFNLYNGTVIYPCGTFPAEQITSQIEVTPSPAYAVESIHVNTDTSTLNDIYSCGPTPPGAGVVSVEYIEVTIPAIPEVNVTLYSPQGGQPVTSLSAVITLAGSNYTVAFGEVTQSSPLLPGHTASAIQVVGTQAIANTTQLDPMKITGGFLDGQTFSYQVQVVVANTYAPA
jgi:hypothetical protein